MQSAPNPASSGVNEDVRIAPASRGQRTGRLEAQISRELDSEVRKDEYQSSRVGKLLLLGTGSVEAIDAASGDDDGRAVPAGESGKSTLYRQMKRIYGVGFSNQELEGYRRSIVASTIGFMIGIISAAERLEAQDEHVLDVRRCEVAAGLPGADRSVSQPTLVAVRDRFRAYQRLDVEYTLEVPSREESRAVDDDDRAM